MILVQYEQRPRPDVGRHVTCKVCGRGPSHVQLTFPNSVDTRVGDYNVCGQGEPMLGLGGGSTILDGLGPETILASRPRQPPGRHRVQSTPTPVTIRTA